MPQPDDAQVPFTVLLSPAAARVLAAHEPHAVGPLFQAVLEQIAQDEPLADAAPIPYTGLVESGLLQRAQRAAAERGVNLDEEIEHVLLRQPVLLPPVPIARLLGVDLSTLSRALVNDKNAPFPVGGSGKRLLYDARAVFEWWPTRRRAGRPATKKDTNETP